MPFSARYTRNAALTAAQQRLLADGRVLLVGLGGLGGHVLDMLIRTGVATGAGLLVGVDGDVFEASNLNRQLLCTESTLGRPKAQVATEYVRAVNSSVRFEGRCAYLHDDAAFDEAVTGMHVVVDALGGLTWRAALHGAAARAGVPVVSAGIAGFSGWVCTVLPGDTGPGALFGTGSGVEETLGNLAFTAGFAASVQAAETVNLLTKGSASRELLLFDLADRYITQARWA